MHECLELRITRVVGKRHRSSSPRRAQIVCGVGLVRPRQILIRGGEAVSGATRQRLVHRRNPFLGGKDHTSHRLIRRGRSVHSAVALIYGAGVLCDGAAIFMSELGRPARIVGIVGILAAAACAAIYLGRIKVYDAHAPVAAPVNAAPSQPIGELDRS